MLLTLLVMLALGEAFLWVIPVEDPHEILKLSNVHKYIPSQFTPNTEYQFTSNEGLPGIDSMMTFSTNNYGFRGQDIISPKGKDKYRIFLVGGSTTECLFIDDRKSNDAVLEHLLTDLNAEVFNAGKSGDITVDHIVMLTNRIVHLEPDLIVVFAGINDLIRKNYDYTHQLIIHDHKDPTFSTIHYLKLILSNSQIYRRMYNVFKSYSIESISFQSNYKERVKWFNRLPLSKEQPASNLAAFEINMKTILGICLANNIKLILVTQATTWDSKLDSFNGLIWMSFIGGDRLPEHVLKAEMEKYNDVLRKIAEESNVLLYDLSNEIEPSREFFYDDCHFNNNGVKFYCEGLENIIRNQIFK